jgi:hypothetical protein
MEMEWNGTEFARMDGTCRSLGRRITDSQSLLLTRANHRHRPSLPRQSHPGRERRARGHPAARGSRLPRDRREERRDQERRVRGPAVRVAESRLLTSHRAGDPQGRQSQHAAADAHPAGRRGEGGRDAVCR